MAGSGGSGGSAPWHQVVVARGPVAACGRVMPKMLKELYAAKAAAERGRGEHPGFARAPAAHRRQGPDGRAVLAHRRGRLPLRLVTRLRAPTRVGGVQRPSAQGHGIGRHLAETFAVPAGGHESIYVSMPPTGLAAATGVVPVASRGECTQERIASRHQSAFWVVCLQEVWGVWARRRISVSLLAPATTVAACRRPG